MPTTVAASRWLRDVYDKVMRLRPTDLARGSAPRDVPRSAGAPLVPFRKAGRDVGTTVAARSYFDTCCRRSRSSLCRSTPQTYRHVSRRSTGSWLLNDDRPAVRGRR